MTDISISLSNISKSHYLISFNYLFSNINSLLKNKVYNLFYIYYIIFLQNIKKHKLYYFSTITLLYISNKLRYYYGINGVKDILLTIPYVKDKIKKN